MKSLVIEKTTIGIAKCEVIMIHDLENQRSAYVYTVEPNFQSWVINQANAFRGIGYEIFNNTEIDIETNK